jgi:hypothetical protein
MQAKTPISNSQPLVSMIEEDGRRIFIEHSMSVSKTSKKKANNSRIKIHLIPKPPSEHKKDREKM